MSYFLTFSLLLILVVYLYQITDNTTLNNIRNANNKKQIQNNNSFLSMMNKKNNLQNNTKQCMPMHRVGPIHNFHQSFAKSKTMPEMGWRNFFLSNYSNNNVVEEDPFSQIPTRHFLDNLESVKNIYREC